jgi:diguanylate cyclase (GGDEF)-like protein
MLLGLFVVTERQDEIAREHEIQLVDAALEGEIERVRALLKDYGYWDGAYENLAVNFDPRFADENFGPLLFGHHGYEHSFILDGSDRTIYATSGLQHTNQSATTSLGGAFNKAVDEIRQRRASNDPRLAGFTRIAGKLAIFGVGPIRPSPGSNRTLMPGPEKLMVVVDYVDSDLLQRIARDHQIANFSLEESGSDERASVKLDYFGGGPAGHVAWRSAAPGSSIRQQSWPWLLAAAAIVVLLAGTALRHARVAGSELLASEVKARHLANHDTLTGLPNRRAFLEQLRTRGPDSGQVGLLYLDLDGFKEVNDVFGHEAGDALLKAATERLHAVVAWRGLLARIGGDEFAILVTGDAVSDNIDVIAPAIVHAFEPPFETAGHRLVVGTSVGVAYDDGSLPGDELVRRADIAMYTAKAEGRGRVRYYEPAMEQGREINKQLECELRDAIGTDQIRVVFQPIVTAHDGKVVSVEALARWQSPSRGDIPPDIFIPIAESSGIINELGKQILRDACSQAVHWDVELAVNLSPAQFWDEGLFGDVTRILEETGFPAHKLELEITEGYLLRRPEAAAQVLSKLQRIGIRVALDDFGTGYASVGYLKRFKLDKLKLDRSFVERIAEDGDAATVAGAIIALGQALHLTITAEGVETRGQADMLRVAGCTHLQGWLYGRPVTGDQLPFSQESSAAA